jgi:hypothetical protein
MICFNQGLEVYNARGGRRKKDPKEIRVPKSAISVTPQFSLGLFIYLYLYNFLFDVLDLGISGFFWQ